MKLTPVLYKYIQWHLKLCEPFRIVLYSCRDMTQNIIRSTKSRTQLNNEAKYYIWSFINKRK